MSEERFGKVVARGNTTQLAQVKQALDECVAVPSPTLQDRLGADYTIEFKTAADMIAAKAIIPGTKKAAWGFVKGPRLLWINSDIASKKPGMAAHIVRHEISHILPMTKAKKAEAMALMFTANGKHPTEWATGSYKSLPRECWADSLAEAMSGKDSPWDDFAYFGLDVADSDLHKFVEIAFRSTGDPTDPDPPGPPLPPNPQAEIAKLTAQLAAVKAKAQELVELAK